MKTLTTELRKFKRPVLNNGTVTSGVAYLASFMLNGIPPVVCETVLKNFYTSFKKSKEQLLS
ncbi:MAG TPA: hypothetical protein VM888_03075 [Chitinophagaceae bacterium]|jgi:hypothetical protein|nr:hypothetical protein [Chitinophagaceae bacterium]